MCDEGWGLPEEAQGAILWESPLAEDPAPPAHLGGHLVLVVVHTSSSAGSAAATASLQPAAALLSSPVTVPA